MNLPDGHDGEAEIIAGMITSVSVASAAGAMNLDPANIVFAVRG